MYFNDMIRRLFIFWSTVEIFIVSVIGKVSKKWYIGRVPPGRFEYDRINGFFTPQRAKSICESDIQCGGFTFKGPKNIRDYKREVYFFHFVRDQVLSFKEYMKYPHWTTYISLRDYVVISGQYDIKSCNLTEFVHGNRKLHGNEQKWNHTLVNDVFQQMSKDAIATSIADPEIKAELASCTEVPDVIQKDRISPHSCGTKQIVHEHQLVDFAKINFHRLSLHETSNIIILRTRNIDRGKIVHSFGEINRCCNATGWNHDVQQLLKFDAVDEMQRIPCNISSELFNRDYVMKSKPVVLMNCTENWKAQNWTFEGLLNRYPRAWNVSWTTSFRHASTNYSGSLENVEAHAILSLLKKGYVIKIFEQLYASLKRLNMSKKEYLIHKMDLFEEYKFPRPFPPDMLLKLPRTPDHAYLILGHPGTGTPMHIDPDVTDAFNALFRGHKRWAALPKDLYDWDTKLTCDRTCSSFANSGIDLVGTGILDNDKAIILWLKNILPQIRGRTFYGKTLVEWVQKPGEVVYMPHFTPHAVYNLDETIAVGDNPFYSSAIEEAAFELSLRNQTIFSLMNEAKVIVAKGFFNKHEQKRYFRTIQQIHDAIRIMTNKSSVVNSDKLTYHERARLK